MWLNETKPILKPMSIPGISSIAILLACAFLFYFFQPPFLQAQEEPPQFKPKHEISVTLKLIQVYVTDSKGLPLTDLEKENFEVYDNGQRKNLTEFEKHLHSFLLSLQSEKDSAVVASEAEPASRKFFLFFDFVYNNPKGLRATKKAALHFLDNIIQADDEIGIITYSLEGGLAVREYLSRDHLKIRRFVEAIGLKDYQSSVENLEARYWQQATEENPLDVSQRGGVGAGIWSKPEKDPIMDSPNVSEEMKRAFMTSESRVQALTFLREMTRLAKALGYLPGIKHLILFSSGIPYSLIYGMQTEDKSRGSWRQDWGQTQLQYYLDDMQKAISHANLVVYAFDTEDSVARINQDLRLTGILTLGKIADYSGGKYFGNIHNYTRGLEEVQKITGCYYVLGYYVDTQWDGQYHEVKVRVNRPKTRVYAQKGYFNPKSFKELTPIEKQLHLVDLCLSEKPLLQEPLALESGGFSFYEKGKENLILWTRLVREEMAKLAGNKLELLFVIFDNEGSITAMERRKIKLSSLPATEAGIVYFSPTFELPAGQYRCRVVMRNLENGQSALGSSDLSLSGEQPGKLTLGLPALLTAGQISEYDNSPLFFPPGWNRYALTSSQLKAGTEEFYALLICSSPATDSPEMEFKSVLIQARDSRAETIASELQPLSGRHETGQTAFLARLKTRPLEPGSYHLYIHITEKTTGARAVRSLSLTVTAPLPNTRSRLDTMS
ncbi:MAG: VWA domain-containing protein [Candidatus Saccharicenans sp.]|uniref:VWA domain-containing protein n=1 Tax=Candidatus Saccharicenans sp. TaxID=2819258 RepID=UPI00404B8204